MNTTAPEVLTFENEILRIKVVPALGGKISSLYDKRSGHEYCITPGEGDLQPAQDSDLFTEHKICGIDECFPTVDAEEIEIDGRRVFYPDHGEIWKNPVDIKATEREVVCSYKSPVFGYSYQKTYRLEGNLLKMSYKIRNESEREFPCIWTFHGVFAYEKESRLSYPDDLKRFENVLTDTILGEPHKIYDYPSSEYDFDSLPDLTGSVGYIKYYCPDELKKGSCMVTYPSKHCALKITYDFDKLPYVGVWVDQAAIGDSRNFAFEMTNGYYDKISRAIENNRIVRLAPGQETSFDISLISLNK